MNNTIFVWKHRTFHMGPHYYIRSWYRSLCWDFRKWCFVQKINIYSFCILKLYCSKCAYSSIWLFSTPFCSLNHEKSVQQPYAPHSSSLPLHFNSWQFINSKKEKKFREMWIEVENEWLTVGEQWTDSNLLSRLCLSNSPHCAYLL